MKKSTEPRTTNIEDIIQMIDDHLMELHRIAEAAVVAETAAKEEQSVVLIRAVAASADRD